MLYLVVMRIYVSALRLYTLSDKNIIKRNQILVLCLLLCPISMAYAATPLISESADFSSRLQQKLDAYDNSLTKKRRSPIKGETITDETITVVIESDKSTYDIDGINRSGGKFRYKFGKRHEIQIPLSRLQALKKNLHKSSRVRLPYPHKALAVVTQGAEISGALDMHILSNQGQGVKIGVIDLGFTSYTASQAADELPLALSIVDYTNTGLNGTNHGTNVAEIVHDMAPAAELYLAKIGSIQQLQQAMLDMQAAGVKVINHSVAWFGTSFYDGTGDVCAITNQAESAGILWVNAMGNSRTAHYLGGFTDDDINLQHEFSSGQNYNTVNLTQGVNTTLVLNWDDYPSSRIDYNLYIYNGIPGSGGSVVASSLNSQSGSGGTPYEAISYTPAFTGTHYIVVTRRSTNTAQIPLTLFTLGPALSTRVTASSLVQPADCASVLSVGAVDLNDNAEGFSSEGPTTNGLNKPDIAATDRTVTSLSSSFAGTSGSSPHVAGAVALILSQNPGFTPLQLRDQLIATAQDVSVAGFDFRTGYGRISLDADQDLVNHDNDNCPVDSNFTQLDTDNDSQGNVCDIDDDNDGLLDSFEIAIGSNVLLIDTDGDGLDDYTEVAFDGDATQYTLLTDLNPLSNDTDNDGFLDADDPLPIAFNFKDGDLAPLGSPDGVINIADYVIARRILSGELLSTELELVHGDVFPANLPDGQITTSDVLLIYQQILQ